MCCHNTPSHEFEQLVDLDAWLHASSFWWLRGGLPRPVVLGWSRVDDTWVVRRGAHQGLTQIGSACYRIEQAVWEVLRVRRCEAETHVRMCVRQTLEKLREAHVAPHRRHLRRRGGSGARSHVSEDGVEGPSAVAAPVAGHES